MNFISFTLYRPPQAAGCEIDTMGGEIDAITRLYDFILWMIPKIEKFPRSRRFTLGNRIENLLLDNLGLLIEAAYTRDKAAMLKQANLGLEKLRYLIRLAKDLKLINIKAYAFASESVDGIGRSVGGWLRYTKREKS